MAAGPCQRCLGPLACLVGVGVTPDTTLFHHPVDFFAERERLPLLELDGREGEGNGPCPMLMTPCHARATSPRASDWSYWEGGEEFAVQTR